MANTSDSKIDDICKLFPQKQIERDVEKLRKQQLFESNIERFKELVKTEISINFGPRWSFKVKCSEYEREVIDTVLLQLDKTSGRTKSSCELLTTNYDNGDTWRTGVFDTVHEYVIVIVDEQGV